MPMPSPTAALINGVATSTADGTDALRESTPIDTTDLAEFEALLIRDTPFWSVDMCCNGTHDCTV